MLVAGLTVDVVAHEIQDFPDLPFLGAAVGKNGWFA
jgi:hypothetical protein